MMCCIPARDQKERILRGPAEFLIDSSGTVRWVNLTDNIAVRARPEQVLEAFNEIESTGR
jgi:hypothetical protein